MKCTRFILFFCKGELCLTYPFDALTEPKERGLPRKSGLKRNYIPKGAVTNYFF